MQNLFRLDESSDEDAQGVYNTMAIIENLIEIKPHISVLVCQKTNILVFLLKRLKTKTFDANKLYCSEILSILLQSETENQKLFGRLHEIDGVDMLLQCIAIYRKKVVDIADEQECVENLFLSLCSVLLVRQNQEKFLQYEGFELMMKCLSEQEYAAGCTLNTLSYAVMKNRSCCERFIEVGGLRYIFPILVGKGLKKALKKKGTGEKRNIEESAISIISQLCSQLYSTAVMDDNITRLVVKFTENDREKLKATGNLLVKYGKQLLKVEADIDLMKETLEREGKYEELKEFTDEENLYLKVIVG